MTYRKNIMRLVTKISIESGTYLGITPTDPEYTAFDAVVTDDMAEVCMGCKLRTPRTAEEIAARVKKPVPFCREQLDKLWAAGILRKDYQLEGHDRYYYPIWVPGIMEGMLGNRQQCEEHPVIAESFERYTRERTPLLVPNIPVGQGLMRIMPVESAIENDSRAASYDELSDLIERAQYISVGPCSCRRSRRLMGEGCGHLEEDMCLYLNDNARSMVELGYHRQIDKKEAYEILKRAEDNGLIHEINNAEKAGDTAAICNCCGCSCYSLRIAEMFRTPDFLRSNYQSQIDPEKCVACGACVEACQVGALKLGRKLCAAAPLPEPEPEKSPWNTPWGKNSGNWDPDYRTDRRLVADTGSSPCVMECPAHLPVQGYIKLAAQGRYAEALELIKKNNPFPAVCGRVCNRQCEDACSRGRLDEPIAIDEVKKFIAQRELSPETRYVPPLLNPTGVRYPNRIAVIGAGPAGLSCAYYLAQWGYSVTVWEKQARPGGMMMLGIPAFRLEKDVVEAEIDVLRSLGVEFRTGVEVGKDVTLADLRREGFEAFYLAVGAWKNAPLGIPGEDLPGVLSGLGFLCAVNSGRPPQVGKNIAVVGGGNVALDVARAAVRLGGRKVTVLYRRSREDMPADPEEVKEALAEGVEFRYLVSPVEITGAGRAEALRLQVMAPGGAEADGRRRASPVEGRFETFPADTVITAVGQRIDWGGLLEGSAVVLGKNGTAQADAVTYQTAQPDVFVGGDAFTGPKFIIDAIAAGKEAAISLSRFVHEGQDLRIGRPVREFRPLDTDNIDFSGWDRAPRQRVPVRTDKSGQDARGTFTEEQLRRETARCLGCGATVVDTNMCLGCGVCTTKCKFDAIRLVRVHDEASEGYEKIIPAKMALGMGRRAAGIAVKTVTAPFRRG